MKNFTYHNPTKIIFGKGSIKELAENLRPFGEKILITYGKGSIKKNGLYDQIMQELQGFEVREFGGIEPNPRVETIRKAVAEHKDFDPDIILAVGGGSVIDGSKLLAAALHYNGDPWDFLTGSPEPERYVALATILTQAATGSEMNNGAVITRWETNEKLFFAADALYPQFSILDPEYTFTVSKEQLAYGIVDAYSHVLEQYLTTAANVPLQDRWSEGILLTLIENAPKALENPSDYEVRANIMLCADMALNNLISMGANEDWATHMIEHEISAFYDIPHGDGLAIITPRWMEVVKAQKLTKIAQYGRRVWGLTGSDEEVTSKAISKTYDFFASLGIKMSLKDWDITTEHFDEMVERLAGRNIGEFPLTTTQIREIMISSLT